MDVVRNRLWDPHKSGGLQLFTLWFKDLFCSYVHCLFFTKASPYSLIQSGDSDCKIPVYTLSLITEGSRDQEWCRVWVFVRVVVSPLIKRSLSWAFMRRWSLTLNSLHDTKDPSLLYLWPRLSRLPMAEYYNYWFVKQSVNRRWESLRGREVVWPVNRTWESYLGKEYGRPLQLLRVFIMEDEGSERSGRNECVWRGIPLTLFSGRLRIIDLYRGPRMRSILPSPKGVSNDRDSDHHVAIDFRPRCLQSPDREKKRGGALWRRHLRPHYQAPGHQEGG